MTQTDIHRNMELKEPVYRPTDILLGKFLMNENKWLSYPLPTQLCLCVPGTMKCGTNMEVLSNKCCIRLMWVVSCFSVGSRKKCLKPDFDARFLPDIEFREDQSLKNELYWLGLWGSSSSPTHRYWPQFWIGRLPNMALSAIQSRITVGHSLWMVS